MNKLDKRMRDVESKYDRQASPGNFLVARVDGRGFSRLTEEMAYEKPFDDRFREIMTGTARHLMSTGFEISYAYTQSDEISLLFDVADTTFSHKYRKLISVLAGEGSASLALALGRIASMDCRVLEFESVEDVMDYFVWRQMDATRNCLIGHVYWALRHAGSDKGEAQSTINGLNTDGQIRLLRELTDTDVSAIPSWQMHGIGLHYENFERVSMNPITGESATAIRRRVKVDLDLPYGKQYRGYVKERTKMKYSV